MIGPEDLQRALALIEQREAEPHVLACLDAMMNGRAPDPFDAFVFAHGIHSALRTREDADDNKASAIMRRHMGLPRRTRSADPAFDPATYTWDSPACGVVMELQAGQITREGALQALAEIVPGSRASHAKLLDAVLAKWQHLPRLPDRPEKK